MKNVLLLMAGTSALVPTLAQAQKHDPLSNVALAVSIGDYFPSDSTVRGAMGDSIFTLGITLANFAVPKSNTFAPNVTLIAANKNGSHFLLIPVTVGYQCLFANQSASTIPFARVDVGLCHFDYSVKSGATAFKGTDIGGEADAQVGVQLVHNWRLTAAYYLFTQENGLSFDGLSLSLTFGLFHL